MNDASTAPVLLDVSDGIATITLNRPEAMNSLDVATKELLLDAVRSVAEDPAVRCVVLTGTGRAFCTGQDLKEHIELLHNGGSDQLFNTVDVHYNPIVSALVAMEKPVVAAVNGVAAGAGASLAFACDLRIVADTAGFNLAFANVALSCDTGASYHLPLLVGPGQGAGAALLPAHDQGRRGARARARHPRRPGRRSWLTEVGALARRLADGPTVALGVDAPLGGLRGRPHLRGGRRVREHDDAAHRGDQRPRGRRRGVRRQGEAGLRGPLTPGAPCHEGSAPGTGSAASVA